MIVAALSVAAVGLSPSLLFAVVVVGGIGVSWVAVAVRQARHERAELRAHERAHRARGAALEAAEEDPIFSPEQIKQSVVDALTFSQALRQAADTGDLEGRPDAHLIAAWSRSRGSWLGGALEVVGEPSVDLLQVVNRERESEDRVVARVRVKVRCRNPTRSVDGIVGDVGARHHAHLDERWTLGRQGNRWMLFSVDGDPLAGPVLTAPLVPTRLR